jgi:hypothetical protein
MRDIAGDDLGNQLGIYALIFGIGGHSSPLFKQLTINGERPAKARSLAGENADLST